MYIIQMTVVDDEGKQVSIREELPTRQDFDRRYCELAMAFDEPIHWTEIK